MTDDQAVPPPADAARAARIALAVTRYDVAGQDGHLIESAVTGQRVNELIAERGGQVLIAIAELPTPDQPPPVVTATAGPSAVTPLPDDAVERAAKAAEEYAVNWPAGAIAAVASAVHLEPEVSWVSDEACAAAALEGLDAWLGRFAFADDVPKAALTAARRAFPVAAPHALKSALTAAAPAIAATERERIVKWMYAEAKRLKTEDDSGYPIYAREHRRDTSRALERAIAHMSAHGLLDGNAKCTCHAPADLPEGHADGQ